MSSDGSEPLEADWQTQTQANDAYWNWVGDGGGEAGGEGGDQGEPTETTESASLSGSLDAPDEVQRGSSFTAEGSVSNDGERAVSGRIVLAVETPDGQQPFAALSEGRAFSLDAGESTTIEFEAVSGALGVEPGEHTLITYAAVDGSREATGRVGSAGVTVVERGGETDEEQSEWGEAYHIEELPYGWHLYGQDHKQEDRTRYIVTGQSNDDEVIFLDKDGTVSKEAVYYDSIEAVQRALEAFAQAVENGNGPPQGDRPSGRRPNPDALKRKLAQARSNRRSRLKMAAAAAGVGVAIYVAWKWRQGDLREVPVVGDQLAEVSS